MTDKNLTEIICVTDRSGSMASIMSDAIGGFNCFLKDQQENKTDRCLFTFAQFDSEYEIIHDCIPIEDVPPLTKETYIPRASTALLDAIGRTIASVGERLSRTAENERPGAVIVVILTDGLENASSEYNRQRVKEMIETQTEKFSWEFIYLAANQNAIAEAQTYGIAMKNAANFSHNSNGVNDIYDNLSKGISNDRETKCSTDLSVDDAVNNEVSNT